MFYLGMLAMATGLGLPIAVLGAGLGQGKAVAAAMEGIARQPEAASQIQTAMIIGLAFIEGDVFHAERHDAGRDRRNVAVHDQIGPLGA